MDLERAVAPNQVRRRPCGPLVRRVTEIRFDAPAALLLGCAGAIWTAAETSLWQMLDGFLIATVLFGGSMWLLTRRNHKRNKLKPEPAPPEARIRGPRGVGFGSLRQALIMALLVTLAPDVMDDGAGALAGILFGGGLMLLAERRYILEHERTTNRHFYREARIRWNQRFFYTDAPPAGGCGQALRS